MDQCKKKKVVKTIGLRFFDYHRCKHCHVTSGVGL
jgi:hypothetical protein